MLIDLSAQKEVTSRDDNVGLRKYSLADLVEVSCDIVPSLGCASIRRVSADSLEISSSSSPTLGPGISLGLSVDRGSAVRPFQSSFCIMSDVVHVQGRRRLSHRWQLHSQLTSRGLQPGT